MWKVLILDRLRVDDGEDVKAEVFISCDEMVTFPFGVVSSRCYLGGDCGQGVFMMVLHQIGCMF